MTLQVGLVGTDGIVIASDTRWGEEIVEDGNNMILRQTFSSPKITINRERGLAISRSQNMETATLWTSKILSTLKDEEWEYPVLPIEAIGAEVLKQAGDRNRVQCLMVFSKPKPRLFWFQFATVNGEWGPHCQPAKDCAVAGECANAAVFWKERYYQPLPTNSLIFLAAHLIFSASKLSEATIKGLEIVICDDSGFHRLAQDSLDDLEKESRKLDKGVGRALLNRKRKQAFSYDPEGAG
jgi:hypothetical protein